MNCTDARRLVELAEQGDHLERARAHAAECESCKAHVVRTERLVARLQRLTTAVAPLALRASIRRSFRRPARRRWTGRAVAVLATAAAVTVAIRLSSPEPMARSLAEAARAGMENMDVRVRGGSVDLAPWLQSAVGLQFEIPDIDRAILVGAGVANLNGDQGVALFYLLDGLPVIYFALRSDEMYGRRVVRPRVHASRADGYQVAVWTEDGAARAIAAPLPRDQVAAIAEECRLKAATD